MSSKNPMEEFGVPDKENPEWTDRNFLWAVRLKDFAGNDRELHDFLLHREKLLSDAEAEGFDRDLFLAFEPNKPGFEDRARRAIAAFKDSAKHAAE